ncbi:MAG TPA: carboxypeptidase-like regulatory domain-containing protein, partial [Desulfomonilia bacterium]|nr:carboxypeptidase-like regulatory domain-containing protein [Desulfomonilia bacterium]
MAKRFLVLIALLMLGFFIAGCAEGDKSSTVVNPNPQTFAPTGSISGTVFDICKNAPVSGAVVSVAYAGKVHVITTGTTGAFSFTAVPAITNARFEDSESDGYIVTCDLTKVTGYGYAVVQEAYVTYEDLADGTNADLGEDSGTTEAGSGANTPVNNLAFTLEFDVGPLNASIAGTIFDVSTGRAVTGATVSLFLGGNFLATTTASATGAYSFANIMPSSDYELMVTKAGYDYASYQAPNTVT